MSRLSCDILPQLWFERAFDRSIISRSMSRSAARASILSCRRVCDGEIAATANAAKQRDANPRFRMLVVFSIRGLTLRIRFLLHGRYGNGRDSRLLWLGLSFFAIPFEVDCAPLKIWYESRRTPTPAKICRQPQLC